MNCLIGSVSFGYQAMIARLVFQDAQDDEFFQKLYGATETEQDNDQSALLLAKWKIQCH